jgi:hypothetical protein
LLDWTTGDRKIRRAAVIFNKIVVSLLYFQIKKKNSRLKRDEIHPATPPLLHRCLCSRTRAPLDGHSANNVICELIEGEGGRQEGGGKKKRGE